MRTSIAVNRIHLSNSRSRSRGAFLAPGFCFVASLTPAKGGRSAESRTGACEAPVGPARNAAGQAPGEAPCVLRRTLASRRSTVAVFGSGAALSLTGLAFGSVPASSSHRAVVPGGGFPYLPGQRLPAAAAGRHALLRVQVVSRTRPLTSTAAIEIAGLRIVVNMFLHL